MTFKVTKLKLNTHFYNLGSISQCQVNFTCQKKLSWR